MCVCVVIKNKMQNPKIQENIIKTMLLGDLASLWGKVHIYIYIYIAMKPPQLHHVGVGPRLQRVN